MLDLLSRGAALLTCHALLLACAPRPARIGAPCRPCAPSNVPSVSSAAAPPARPWALPAIPANTACTVHDTIARGDVSWPLRTRPDAIPSLLTRSGSVTAWLVPRVRNELPRAVVQIENSVLTVRAQLASEDMKFVLTSALVAEDFTIPDGISEHHLLTLEDGAPYLEVVLPYKMETTILAACEQLGLARRVLDLSGILPPLRRQILLPRGTKLRSPGGRELPVDKLETINGRGTYLTGSIEAELLDDDPVQPLVAFRQMCGGTVFGRVERRALRAVPASFLGYGTSAHCPNTGDHIFVMPELLTQLLQCDTALAIFLRTGTLEDAVGELKAHARFRLDEATGTGTRAITVLDPPVELLPFAHFSVRAEDLAVCRAAPEPD